MVKIENKKLCCGCSACASVCPKNCIDMVSDIEGFKYPHVNVDNCINCGMCEKVCPIINTDISSKNRPVAYGAYNNNESSLMESSSGGIFYLLADSILANNGVVFGAAYNKDFSVSHICISDKKDIAKLQTSKYVQSSMGNTYSQVRKILAEGRQVLFSGAPCQVEGLLKYLGKSYSNLYTVDFVCSGVPSPLIWNSHLEWLKKKKHSEIKAINLRYKKYGWQEYIVLFQFDNGKVYKNSRFEDVYMRAFREHLSLRPSCYECRFKTLSRNSDITLGDFWGVEKTSPEINNRFGTSLVLIQSPKGKDLYSSINHSIHNIETDCDKAISNNPMMVKSANCPDVRDKFISFSINHSLKKAINKYAKINLKQKVRFFIDRLLRITYDIRH